MSTSFQRSIRALSAALIGLAALPAAAHAQAPTGTDTSGLFGGPSEASELDWPLGLRILAPAPEAEALRRQIESVLRLAADRPNQGSVPSYALDRATLATGRLRKLLHRQRERIALAEQTVRDATNYLHRLETAFQALRQRDNSR